MVEELLKWMNHSDIDEGNFAVGEISQNDVNTWLSDILKEDYNLSLVFWAHNELALATDDGSPVMLAFDGERWAIVPNESSIQE